MRRLLLSALVALCLVTPALAQGKPKRVDGGTTVVAKKPGLVCPQAELGDEALQARYTELWGRFTESVEEATSTLAGEITAQTKSATKKADLDLALFWDALGKEFALKGELRWDEAALRKEWSERFGGGLFPARFRNAVKRAAESYASATQDLEAGYGQLVVDLTKAGAVERARQTREEIKGLLIGSDAGPSSVPSTGRPTGPTPSQGTSPQLDAHGWQDITAELVGGVRNGHLIAARGGVASGKRYSPPLEIEYVCATSRDNIRLGYACDELIFNWENNRNQLRIDGGPAGGQHVMNAGAVPAGQFITIRQVIMPGEMSVFVNGQRRASWARDFSKVKDLIELHSPDSELLIRAVRIKQVH
jgi:hypothetical protein